MPKVPFSLTALQALCRNPRSLCQSAASSLPQHSPRPFWSRNRDCVLVRKVKSVSNSFPANWRLLKRATTPMRGGFAHLKPIGGHPSEMTRSMSKDETAIPTGIALTHLDPVLCERPDEYPYMPRLREPVHQDRMFDRLVLTRAANVEAVMNNRNLASDPRKSRPGSCPTSVSAPRT